MVMGAFLGYLFLWSGSLWPSILAHFLNNGAAVYVVWLANRGTISDDIDTIGTDDGQIVFVILSVLIVSACLYVIHKLENKNKLA